MRGGITCEREPPNDGNTETVETVSTDALVAMSESSEDGPAENRTPNPLIKSCLGDEATTGHDGLPPEIPRDRDREDPP